jgi:1-pyrroline-5-carboxylate dehydrogenase
MAVSKFRNESYYDWSKPAPRKKQEAALAVVRADIGKEYPIVIGGERMTMPQKFNSYNPSRSAEILGVFQKGDAAVAGKAIDAAVAKFEEWKSVPYQKRADYLFKAARLMRKPALV